MTMLERFNVSRETLEKLKAFEALVLKWTPKINLISKGSASAIWERHFIDSAQLFHLAGKSGHWVDIGSGGGFPGVVVAILSDGLGQDRQFTLVESDQRKCVFLRTAARELDLRIRVIAKRIEEIDPLHSDVLSARALSDLSDLLVFAERHLKQDGIALFPKGESWKKEHERAQNRWSYRCEAIKSETNAAAAVLKIQDIKRV